MKEATAPPAALQNEDRSTMRLLTRVELRQRLGNISDDKLYSLIREGELAPPIKLGSSSRWLETDLESFISKLAKVRQVPSTPAGICGHHAKLAENRKRRAMELAANANSKQVMP